jgi:hypothetical protein
LACQVNCYNTITEDATLAKLLEAAANLQELLLPHNFLLSGSTAAAVFRHGSLQVLKACYINCDPKWQGVVLEGSQLEELVCWSMRPTELQPDPFASLPVFPKLNNFYAINDSWQSTGNAAAGGQQTAPHRFLGTCRVIHNHSSTQSTSPCTL